MFGLSFIPYSDALVAAWPSLQPILVALGTQCPRNNLDDDDADADADDDDDDDDNDDDDDDDDDGDDDDGDDDDDDGDFNCYWYF